MTVTLPKSVDTLIKKYWNNAQTDTSIRNATNFQLLNDILQLDPKVDTDDKATINWMRSNFDLVLNGIVNGYSVMGDQESNQAIPTNNDTIAPTVTVTKVHIPSMIDYFIQENYDYSKPLTSITSFLTDDKYQNDDSYDNQLSWITNHSTSFLSAVVNGYLVGRYFYVYIPLSQYFATIDGRYLSYDAVKALSDDDKVALIFTSEKVTQLGWWSYAHDLSDEKDTGLFPDEFYNDDVDLDTKIYKWEKPDDGADNDLSTK